MNVYLVMYEHLRYGNRIAGVGSTLEQARGIAAEWLLQRWGYLIPRWPEETQPLEENGLRYWYTDVHGHIMCITEIGVDAPVNVEPAEDE